MFRGKVKNRSVVNHGLDILQTSWLVISLSLKSCFVFTILWAHAFLLLDSGERQEIRGQEMGNDMYYMSSGQKLILDRANVATTWHVHKPLNHLTAKA